MIHFLEMVAALFLLTRSLCILNKMEWHTNPGMKAGNVLQALACFAIVFMPLFGLPSKYFGWVVFGVDAEQLPYLLLLLAMITYGVFDRRRDAQGLWPRINAWLLRRSQLRRRS